MDEKIEQMNSELELMCYGGKRTNFLNWEEYFLAVAFLSAMRSKDPASQVGACIVNPLKRIVSIGYNGMPSGCGDDDLPWGKTSQNPLETKYLYVCHAEMNAVMNKNSSDVSGCTIYVALFPCNECTKILIQSRIKSVVYYSDKHSNKASTIASKHLLQMAGIPYRQASSCSTIHLNFNPSIPKAPNGTLNSTPPINQNEKRPNYISWEEYFMSVAFLSAQRSKDPSIQVGACISNNQNKIVGIGYNGMPYGCDDDKMPWSDINSNEKYNKSMYICHAEMNAILNKNCHDLQGCRLYVTKFPCNECAKLIIQAAITEVIYFQEADSADTSAAASRRMFDLVPIKCRKYEGNLQEIYIDFEAINWNSSIVPLKKQ